MRRPRLLGRARVAVLGATVMLPAIAVGTGATTITASADGNTRLISSSGTAFLKGTSIGSDTYQVPEIRQGDAGGSTAGFSGSIKDSSGGGGGTVTKSNANLLKSFDGLNHRQQRLANGGNQFSVEPPDQGLCEGAGFVVETVNDVTRVYDTSGNALTSPEDLNTFFGYAAAINRTTGARGPFVTDPSCLFDHASQRWFMDVLTLEVNPANGHFLGPNHLDLAVSNTSNPMGAWTIYRTAVQDDGTQGTPNHKCPGPLSSPGNLVDFGPCLGDYPHIGADANGVYLTTNEYAFFASGTCCFHGAQVYAFSKHQLVSLASTITVTQIDTHGTFGGGLSGFTVWPATSPSGNDGWSEDSGRGVEYFLSSNSAGEAHDTGNGIENPAPSNQVIVWSLGNTRSLNNSTPAVKLSHTTVHVGLYAAPPPANQKAGPTPLADCLNDNTTVITGPPPFPITGCSTVLLGGPDPFAPNTEFALDSNDTRMQQVTFADGHLWGALDTTLTLKGVKKAAIEWFVIDPSRKDGQLSAKTANNGYLGLAGNNLTYPAIGVTEDGKGVMAFTVVGKNYFPSAGYATIDEEGVGKIHVAAQGKGPEDGFAGYAVFNAPNPARPRWGDYGAAVPDGNNIWIASEYIGQTCTFAQYITNTAASPFGSCDKTRTSLGNWDTRISLVSTS